MKKSLVAAILMVFASGCINGIDQIITSEKTSVVVVGVENGFAGKCPGSLKDADDMSKLLKKYSSDVQVLKDARATSAAVYTAMSKAVKADLAVIYFSGHGGSQRSLSYDEADGADEYICCFDQEILDDDIWKLVLSAKGRVFFIFDCCHSETMFRTPGVTMRCAVARLAAPRSGSQVSMLCWSGCPDDSYSYGSASGGEFTSALLRYAQSSKSYDDVWKKISTDVALASQQRVCTTKIGKFDTKKSIFK